MNATGADDRRAPLRVLVLGGYGHFGGRIARTLGADARFEVLVGGRDAARAAAFVAASGEMAAFALQP